MAHADESDAEALQRMNGRRTFHPMSDPSRIGSDPATIIAHGDGVYVTDIAGRRMIDGQSGLWCVNAGYGRSEIISAITAQLQDLAFYTCFPGSANVPSIRLGELLCDLTAREGMAKAMFGSSGSDAVETALKIARQYWKIIGQPGKTKFISLRGGYHGMHFGGMSAGGGSGWSQSYEPLVPGFINAEYPNIHCPPLEGYDPEALAEICIRLLEREILFQSPGTIAALIAEPIQGAGGVNVPPPNYWGLLRSLCDRHGILLIADEVVTGFGRSGTLFGVRHWDVKPDIMCLAKGITSGYIPLSATLFHARIAAAWEAPGPNTAIMHGYTYSGHPVACAAGLAAIALAVDEDHAGRARAVGDCLLSELELLRDRCDVLGDIRGRGLMIAVELVQDREAGEGFGPQDDFPSRLSAACQEEGVMLRTMGSKFILSPPLIITIEQAKEIVAALERAIDRTMR